MKTGSILFGIAITGAGVTAASAALGVSRKKHKCEKQSLKIINSLNDSFKDSSSTINKVYRSTIDSLDVKSQYERTQVAVAALKKDFFYNEDGFLNLAKVSY